jgi:hypothetical protein
MNYTLLTREDFYPLGDRYPGDIYRTTNYRAKWTGEYRPPKKGEWYLSGAFITAFRAYNDLEHSHNIATIYKVRKVEYWEEVKDGS